MIQILLPNWIDTQFDVWTNNIPHFSSFDSNTQRSRVASLSRPGLDIRLVGPVARGASRFENLLAPQKIYWLPKKQEIFA